MDAKPEVQWRSSEEFLAAKLHATETEMGTAILNRGRWDKLRDDRRLLVFLQWRTHAPDFEGVRADLSRIGDGRLRVPDLDSPRRKATDCLSLWASDLALLDQLPKGVPAIDAVSAEEC